MSRWFALIRAYPVSLLSSFTFLTPLFGVAFGAALLNEPVSAASHRCALLLVAVGIYLVNRGAALRRLRARAERSMPDARQAIQIRSKRRGG